MLTDNVGACCISQNTETVIQTFRQPTPAFISEAFILWLAVLLHVTELKCNISIMMGKPKATMQYYNSMVIA